MKKNQGLQVSFDEDLKLKKELQTFRHKYHQEEFNISLEFGP